MEIFLLWFVGAIVVAIIAGSRGRNGFGWFVLAIMLSPLLMGILVLALGRPAAAAPPIERRVQCPECMEQVHPMAVKCKHCGSKLSPQG